MEKTCSGDNAAFVGNGLSNIKSRAMELKADINFKSEHGLGTYLRITFKKD
jgi:signal transduction histidine kinase